MRTTFALLGLGIVSIGVTACADFERALNGQAAGPSAELVALGDAPANPRPGACYSQVIEPPKFRTVVEQVREKGSREVRVIEPVYRTVKERILVQEATEREVEVAPTFKTVQEEVVVQPAYEKLEVTPPVFRQVREEVIVDPEPTRQTRRVVRTTEVTSWQPPSYALKAGERVIDQRAVDGFLLVVRPQTVVTNTGAAPRKQVITRQELVEPARTRKVTVPAETRMVTRRVIDQEASVRIERVPEKFIEVERRELVTPERRVIIEASDTTRDVETEVLMEGSRLVWAEILCENVSTAGTLRSVQEQLFNRGLYTGPIDGASSPSFRDAVTEYQEEEGLATGGLTIETIRALGVSVETGDQG